MQVEIVKFDHIKYKALLVKDARDQRRKVGRHLQWVSVLKALLQGARGQAGE